MIMPRVVFKYSWIYDQRWKEISKSNKYPSRRKILKYKNLVERLWRKEERKVLREISSISNLKWKEKVIDCYVVGYCIPFSYPLTLPIFEKHPNYFIDILIHELIHQIFIQNGKKTEKAFNYFLRKYKKEPFNTRIHIPLHAIHTHIYLKFFGRDRLGIDIRESKKYQEYRKSWQIVMKEGHQNIIREFTKRI